MRAVLPFLAEASFNSACGSALQAPSSSNASYATEMGKEMPLRRGQHRGFPDVFMPRPLTDMNDVLAQTLARKLVVLGVIVHPTPKSLNERDLLVCGAIRLGIFMF
jgi:hypothetical protein